MKSILEMDDDAMRSHLAGVITKHGFVDTVWFLKDIAADNYYRTENPKMLHITNLLSRTARQAQQILETEVSNER